MWIRRKEKKFRLEVIGGNATLYFSRTEPEPDEENYEYKMFAKDGQPAEFEVTPTDMSSASSGSALSGVSRKKRQSSSTSYTSILGTGDVRLTSEESATTGAETSTGATTKGGVSAGSALVPFGFVAAMLALVAVYFK